VQSKPRGHGRSFRRHQDYRKTINAAPEAVETGAEVAAGGKAATAQETLAFPPILG
jgi:hypothetical protein